MSTKHLPENATRTEDVGLARREAGVPAARTALAHVEDDLMHADKICIEGLEVWANHGVYPEETALGQKFVVSLTIYADTSRAGATDDLDASIDYGAVAHDVDAFLRDNTYKLIEAAAEGVAALVLRRYPAALGVRVRLEKPWAPVGLPLATVAVEIERTRAAIR